DRCGDPRCPSGEYVRVTRLGDHVVWSASRPELSWDGYRAFTDWVAGAVVKQGALLIPVAAWAELRDACPSVPSFVQLSATTRRDLEQVWLAGAGHRPTFDATDTREVRDAVLAAHPIDVAQAVSDVVRLARWFRAAPDGVVAGGLRPVLRNDPALV